MFARVRALVTPERNVWKEAHGKTKIQAEPARKRLELTETHTKTHGAGAIGIEENRNKPRPAIRHFSTPYENRRISG